MGKEKKFKLFYYTGGLLATAPQEPQSQIFCGISEDFINTLDESGLFDGKAIRVEGNLVFDENNKYEEGIVYCCGESWVTAQGVGQIHVRVTSVERIKGEYQNDISKLSKILANNSGLEETLLSTLYALLYIGVCAAFERYILSIVTYFLYEDSERLKNNLSKVSEMKKFLPISAMKDGESYTESSFRIWYAIRTMSISNEKVDLAVKFIDSDNTLSCQYDRFKELRNNLVHRNGILQNSTYKKVLVSKEKWDEIVETLGDYVIKLSEQLSELPHSLKGLDDCNYW